MGSTDPKGEGDTRYEPGIDLSTGTPRRLLMPSAADVARIPQAVRDHALVMLQLGAATSELRKRWTAMRDEYKRWLEGDPDTHLKGTFPELRAIAKATRDLWDAELAQEKGAALYRAQLAENNARPTGERWSPTALALWARCSNAAQKPA